MVKQLMDKAGLEPTYHRVTANDDIVAELAGATDVVEHRPRTDGSEPRRRDDRDFRSERRDDRPRREDRDFRNERRDERPRRDDRPAREDRPQRDFRDDRRDDRPRREFRDERPARDDLVDEVGRSRF